MQVLVAASLRYPVCKRAGHRGAPIQLYVINFTSDSDWHKSIAIHVPKLCVLSEARQTDAQFGLS